MAPTFKDVNVGLTVTINAINKRFNGIAGKQGSQAFPIRITPLLKIIINLKGIIKIKKSKEQLIYLDSAAVKHFKQAKREKNKAKFLVKRSRKETKMEKH